MGFGTAVATCFRKYVDFEGRARRSEYWFFYLFNILVYTALFVLLGIGGSLSDGDNPNRPLAAIAGIGFLLYLLGSFLPMLAVTVRRLHDTDRSGWWYLISLVPFGPIVLIIFLCIGGTHGTNTYGSDPLADPAEAFS